MFHDSKIVKAIVATNPPDCRIDTPYTPFTGSKFVHIVLHIHNSRKTNIEKNEGNGSICKICTKIYWFIE